MNEYKTAKQNVEDTGETLNQLSFVIKSLELFLCFYLTRGVPRTMTLFLATFAAEAIALTWALLGFYVANLKSVESDIMFLSGRFLNFLVLACREGRITVETEYCQTVNPYIFLSISFILNCFFLAIFFSPYVFKMFSFRIFRKYLSTKEKVVQTKICFYIVDGFMFLVFSHYFINCTIFENQIQ